MSGTIKRLASQYLQCSFRGIPFAVMGSGGQSGRNVAIHAYPYRDGVWVEDMGRQARLYRIAGLLVGPLCYAQRDLLQRASEIAGAGLLVHPSVGALQASLTRFEWRERDGATNVIDLSFEFIEKNDLLGGLVTTALHAAIGVAAVGMEAASQSDYKRTTSAGFARGRSVLAAGQSVGTGWAAGAISAIQSPRALSSAATVLPGNNGRYAAGNSDTTVTTSTEDSVIVGLTASRASLDAAAGAVGAAADADALSASVFALAEALRAALADPGAQIALLGTMTACSSSAIASAAPIGGAIATVQSETARICRLAALCSLARACADWVPASSDEAETLRQTVAGMLDAEATLAADAGWDATWQAMRALRTQVTQDLSERAARLPDIVTIQRNEPMPALTLAQQIYADGSRADDLVRRANPVHPAFMPTTFEALSS